MKTTACRPLTDRSTHEQHIFVLQSFHLAWYLTIQQNPGLNQPVSKGVALHRPSTLHSKSSLAFEVFNGMLALANQNLSFCHVTMPPHQASEISVLVQPSSGFIETVE